MKPFITALIAIGIIATIFFFIGKGCSKEETETDHTRENELLQNIQQLETVNKSLTAQRDSLLKIPQKIKTQIIYREAQIDSAIAKDSTNALVQYRQALTENGDLPESGEYLSFREIGLGAKNMARLPHLRLTIKTYEEIVKKDNEIISNLNFQIEANEDLREMQRLAIINCENKLDKANSFWNSNELWFGLGIVGATAVAIIIGSVK